MSDHQTFATRLLAWFDTFGRKDLPWQVSRTAYRVWVSEVMLQQTQVATVIPYFERFMATYPDIRSLALAPIDEVLSLWTGLGYYARARNLHRCAQQVINDHGGEFPDSLDALNALPGIGRSTAGAIHCLAQGGRAPILDGNVKRVIARHDAVRGWPGEAAVAHKLWCSAETYTPYDRVADYTQAIMDLGATCCTSRNPACERCPLQSTCQAHKMGTIDEFPGKKPRRATPTRALHYLALTDSAERFLLQKRCDTGIWGGLWCFPEFDSHDAAVQWLRQHWPEALSSEPSTTDHQHAFTHFRLQMKVISAHLDTAIHSLMLNASPRQHCFTLQSTQVLGATDLANAMGQANNATLTWVTIAQAQQLGLPAPVKYLMPQLARARELTRRVK